jgi:hypothetical protein
LAWLGLAWLGLAWLGLAWLGLAWLGLAWLGLAPVILTDYTTYENGIECSETSAFEIQIPGNHPKGRMKQSKSCETRGCHRTLSRVIPGSIFDFSNTCCLADI